MRFALLLVAAFLAVDPTGWDSYGPLRFALISTIGFASIAVSFGAGDVRSQPLPRWSVIGWTVVVSAMVVSSVLSSDRWHALIGTPDRHFGLATWILLAGLFAVSSLYPQTAGARLTVAATSVAAISGVWSILEVFDVGWFGTDFPGDRAGGAFGQPGFFGAGMLLIVPLSAAMAYDKTQRRITRIAAFGASSLGVVALGLSQSRAAWIGALVVLLVIIIRRRTFVFGLVAVVFLGVVMVFTPLSDRAATLTDTSTGAVPALIDEWTVGVRALVDTPTFGLTGHGPEGYRTVVGRHVGEAYVVEHGRDVVTDRAHNVLLDTALQGGIIAGVGMALLIAGLGVTALQRIRTDDPLDVALSAAVLGYLVQQFARFPLAELDPVLWVFAGVLVARRPHRQSYPPPLFRQVSGSTQMVMLAAGLVAAISAVAGLSDVAADHAVASATEALASNDPELALELADTARSRRPDSIRYDLFAARVAQIYGMTLALDGQIDEAISQLTRATQLAPTMVEPLLNLATVQLEDGRLDEGRTSLDAVDVLAPSNARSQELRREYLAE